MATPMHQADMMMSMISVKNTFLDINKFAECSVSPVRRSSSIPRSFKPGQGAPLDNFICGYGLLSDDSTDDASASQDFPDYCSDCTDISDSVHPCVQCASEHSCGSVCNDEDQKSRVTLSLSDMVTEESMKVALSLSDMVTEESMKVRLKLRPQAVPFTSVRTPPTEVETLIANAVEVLSSGKDIVDVQTRDGGMSGTTTIVAKTCGGEEDAPVILSLVKDALLSCAETSESTYIMGYGSQPFNNLDVLSFSASIGCVPAQHAKTACWDMYEKGFCPRRAACQWDHPSENDMMRIIVMIKKDPPPGSSVMTLESLL